MAKNLIQRPRFFVDSLQYWEALGVFPNSEYYTTNFEEEPPENEIRNLFGLQLNQEIRATPLIDTSSVAIAFKFNKDSDDTSGADTLDQPHVLKEIEALNYFAVFGHNFETLGVTISLQVQMTSTDNTPDQAYIETIYNGDDSAGVTTPTYDGTTITKFNGWAAALEGAGNNIDQIREIAIVIEKINGAFDGTEEINISGISIGRYYRMPMSPDLKTTVTYETGIKTSQSLDGSDYNNIQWTGARKLRNGYPFFYVKAPHGGENELAYENRNYISPVGRRTWTMNFTALDANDIFSANTMETQQLQTEEGTGMIGEYQSGDTTDVGGTSVFTNTIHSDTSLQAVVIQRTLAGALPLIYQGYTDTNGVGDNNPSEWALAKVGGGKLQFNKNTHNTYNIGLTVRESW